MRTQNLEKLEGVLEIIVSEAIKKSGEYFQDSVHDTIEFQKGNWKPLKISTVQRKGHDKILIEFKSDIH